jgi:hypothetical protein
MKIGNGFVAMRKNDPIGDEIRAQRKLIHQLKGEVFGIDKTADSNYIREFNSELRDYRRVCSPNEIFGKAATKDVVYIGDYHPLAESQELVISFMRELTRRGRQIVMGMEMLYTHQQELLDLWMKGKMSEEEFLSAIEYKHEWGFNWDSFRAIFCQAKDPFIPIFGIDAELRDHLRFIRKRDRLIARRLVNIRSFFPKYLLLVVIGESHLATNHLPAQVHKLAGGNLSEITVLQNCDEIYWNLLKRKRQNVKTVEIDRGRYCVFTAPPIEKYQSYRDIFVSWSKGEDEQMCLTVLNEMVGSMIDFIPGREEGVHVSVGGGEKVSIDDLFPEVQCRLTYDSFSTYLRSKGFSSRGLAATLENLRNYGISYIPSFNSMLVVKFDFSMAAHEAGRFVARAMRDRIGGYGISRLLKEDRFYAFVMEEALSYYYSKIVDPTRDCIRDNIILKIIDHRGAVREALPRHSLEETRKLVKLLKYHFKRDSAGGGIQRITARLSYIHSFTIRKRQIVIRALGETLGEAIYNEYLKGSVTRRDLMTLMKRKYEERGESLKTYLRWTRMVKPFRGGWGKMKSS